MLHAHVQWPSKNGCITAIYYNNHHSQNTRQVNSSAQYISLSGAAACSGCHHPSCTTGSRHIGSTKPLKQLSGRSQRWQASRTSPGCSASMRCKSVSTARQSPDSACTGGVVDGERCRHASSCAVAVCAGTAAAASHTRAKACTVVRRWAAAHAAQSTWYVASAPASAVLEPSASSSSMRAP